PALARVSAVEWQCVGSEIEALLREAMLIRELKPIVNVQTAAPTLDTRALPPAVVRDVMLLVPSIDPAAVEMIAARADGPVLIQRTPRNAASLGVHAKQVWGFFRQSSQALAGGCAPLV